MIEERRIGVELLLTLGLDHVPCVFSDLIGVHNPLLSLKARIRGLRWMGERL